MMRVHCYLRKIHTERQTKEIFSKNQSRLAVNIRYRIQFYQYIFFHIKQVSRNLGTPRCSPQGEHRPVDSRSANASLTIHASLAKPPPSDIIITDKYPIPHCPSKTVHSPTAPAPTASTLLTLFSTSHLLSNLSVLTEISVPPSLFSSVPAITNNPRLTGSTTAKLQGKIAAVRAAPVAQRVQRAEPRACKVYAT